MKIKIITPISKPYQVVYQKFDRKLFEFLQPVFPKMKLLRFDGSSVGNQIHIQFLFPLYADWISEITEEKITDSEAYFIDEGLKLPLGLGKWIHRHIVRKVTDSTCEIIDDIEFEGVNKLMGYLLWPQLFMSFYPRKSKYQKFFEA